MGDLMGLDMYLYGKLDLSVFSDIESELIEKINSMLEIKTQYYESRDKKRIEHNSIRAEGITISLAYWRKANQIHKWFVDNVQHGKDECEPHYVEKGKLEQLLKTCKSVLKNKDGDKVLPPKRGFFFGSTEIDEWYYKDLENTISQLETIFKLMEKEPFNRMNLYYRSSW